MCHSGKRLLTVQAQVWGILAGWLQYCEKSSSFQARAGGTAGGDRVCGAAGWRGRMTACCESQNHEVQSESSWGLQSSRMTHYDQGFSKCKIALKTKH